MIRDKFVLSIRDLAVKERKTVEEANTGESGFYGKGIRSFQ